MANNKSSFFAYKVAAGVLALVIAISMGLVSWIFFATRSLFFNTIASVELFSEINDATLFINEDVLRLVAHIDDGTVANSTDSLEETIQKDIEQQFATINGNMAAYEHVPGHSELEMRRYEETKDLMIYFQNEVIMKNMKTLVDASSTDEARSLYEKEILPWQKKVAEGLANTIAIGAANGNVNIAKRTITYYVAMGVLALALIGGLVGIWYAARRAKLAAEAIAEQNSQLKVAGRRIEQTAQKMEDLTLNNLLTGMKNRYALEEDISDRLESDQFTIAVLDMDNFRMINDTYGYGFGDEYLSAVATRLKEEFDDIAEIYNIAGNEFCFVFNKEVPDTHAQRIADKVRVVMSETYDVLGINVQTTASGSVYRYLPNDSLNVDSLLIKMDNVLHEVKRNGGNAVYTVDSL